MQQRNLAGVSRRPAGTDGSDFSYRMVVESRYTKVAKGKSKLHRLIIVQGFIQFVGLLGLLLSATKEKSIDTLALASTVIGLMSSAIGQLGQSRSKVTLLKFFMVASSVAVVLSMASLGSNNLVIEIIRDPIQWRTNKILLLEITGVIFGMLVPILAISTTLSLVQNMSPPKKAS